MKRLILILTLALFCTVSYAQAIDVHPKAPAVPEYVDFAGDRITFDRDDLYERMDRELMTFTYMHTTSSLMLKRSVRFFAQVVPILKEKGIPEDLKYLMGIESNLDPKAVSVSGAAGLWQFTKATARQYGLEVSEEVDERFNIEKETIAACKYLKEAYNKYHDWMTVAASYNAGQGGISRRLQDQKEDSALDLYLPEETSRYMFRVLTAKLFMEHPERFGYDITGSELYSYRKPAKVVTVTGPIPSLVEFAKNNGVSYAALKRANLWLRGDKLTNAGGKAYQIIIPALR